MRQWLQEKRADTMRTYSRDLADFAAFSGFDTAEEAMAWLLSLGQADLNAAVLGYRHDLLTRKIHGRRRPGFAPSTINRHLSAIRSFAKLARTVGYTTCSIEIEGVRARPYRSTSGVGHEAYMRMLMALEAQAEQSPKAARDALIIRLLHDVGLRRAEVVRLDLEDVRRSGRHPALFVQGKTDDELVEIAEDVDLAIETWTEHRGLEPGPLITTSRFPKGTTPPMRRVDRSTINRLVTAAGIAVDVHNASPHGFRHSGTTKLLDELDGDVRRVRGWTRHRNVETVLIYDDNRRKDVRQMQSIISAPHPRRKKK